MVQAIKLENIATPPYDEPQRNAATNPQGKVSYVHNFESFFAFQIVIG
jgi:hypothetical protein